MENFSSIERMAECHTSYAQSMYVKFIKVKFINVKFSKVIHSAVCGIGPTTVAYKW